MDKSKNDEYSVDEILKDAEILKKKIIKRESEEQSKLIGEKMEAIKEHIAENSSGSQQVNSNKRNNIFKRLIPFAKPKVEDIFSDTNSEIKTKLTNPLDVLPYDSNEKTSLKSSSKKGTPNTTVDSFSKNTSLNHISSDSTPKKTPKLDENKSSPQMQNTSNSKQQTVSDNSTAIKQQISKSSSDKSPLKEAAKKTNEKEKSVKKDIDKKQQPPIISLSDNFDIRRKTMLFEFEESNTYKKMLKNSKKQKTKPVEKEINIPEETQKTKNRFSFFSRFKNDDISSTDESLNEMSFHDYTCPNDIDSIKKDTVSNCKSSLIRTILIFIIMVVTNVSPILIRFMPNLIQSLNIPNFSLVYSSVTLGLLLLCIAICFPTIKNGLTGLFKLKGNTDSAISIALMATTVQAAISFIDLGRFGETKKQISLFAGIAVIGLFFNSIGKLYKALRIRNNFKFVSSASQKYCAKICDDTSIACNFADGLNVKKPIIAYQKKTNFLSDFLAISNSADLNDKLSYYVAPISTILAFIISVITLFIRKDIINSISIFTLISCICIPISSSFAINNLLYKICKTSLKQSSMISGYDSVKQFSKVNTVIIDENELYPNGFVSLIGLKTFSALRLDESILCAAAVVNSAGGPMKSIFDNVIKEKKEQIPKVSEVKYIEGLGLVSWANGKRILIGNRELLKMHGISAPSKEFELSHKKKNHEITYFAKGGELVAALILSYLPNKKIKARLQSLEKIGVNIIVKTTDQNLTKDFISYQFNLLSNGVKVLSTEQAKTCSDFKDLSDVSSPAYLGTKGNIASFLYLIESCIKVKDKITTTVTLQMISLILGLAIVSIISFYSIGIESTSFVEILIYTLFWSVSTILISKIQIPQK